MSVKTKFPNTVDCDHFSSVSPLFSAAKMYDPDEDYLGGGGAMEEDESEEIPNEIWQEACWIVISAYFEEKGRNQIAGKCRNRYYPSGRQGIINLFHGLW